VTTTREQIEKFLTELTPDYVGADYLREVESWLEEIQRDLNIQHPLVIATLKKISKRICFLEIGES